MAKKGSKTFLALGDVHVPHQNLLAVQILRRVADRLRPDLVVCLGDLLDCGQFSTHPPTYRTPYGRIPRLSRLMALIGVPNRIGAAGQRVGGPARNKYSSWIRPPGR